MYETEVDGEKVVVLDEIRIMKVLDSEGRSVTCTSLGNMATHEAYGLLMLEAKHVASKWED